MIVVCEPVSRDGLHVPFNAGMLEIVRQAFPDEETLFFGDRTHIAQLQTQVQPSTAAFVSWRSIPPPGRRSTRSEFLNKVKIIRNVLQIPCRDRRKSIVFTNVRPSILLILKMFEGRARREGISVQAILHSQISELGGRRSRNPLRGLMNMRTALTLFGKGAIQYLVLEEGIREVLTKRLPSLAERVEVLEHPLPPNEGESTASDLSSPIRFGFLGLANEQKGFPRFVRLASEITEKYRGQAEFHVIGRLPTEGSRIGGMEALATKPGIERLDRAHFMQGLSRLDFVIFPFQQEHYHLSASGTLLDAIAWEKPVIATRMPIFENLFTKFGDIGYLFRDDDELRGVVEKIVRSIDQGHYRTQRLNIRKVKLARTPGALAATYRRIRDKAVLNAGS